MKLIHLEYFVTVCRLGSTTQAAAALSISQPAISAAIRELEGEFGVLLFTRVGKRLEITEAGRILYDRASDLLERAENTAQILTDIAQKRNHLRLGITPMLAALLLPRLFKEFHTMHPNVAFSLFEGGRQPLFEKLDSRELDMVICSHNTETDPSYHIMPLTNLEFGLCVHAGHRLAQQESVRIKDLADEPLAVFSLGFQMNQVVERAFARNGLSPNIIFRTSQISTMWEMVSNELASCFIYTALQSQRPDLCFLPLDEENLSKAKVPINLYWRKRDFFYSDMEKLIHCIKSAGLNSFAKP